MGLIKQKDIALKLNVTESYVSQVVNTKKRPNWKFAKRIAEITNTDPVLWLEGSQEDIRNALSNIGEAA